MERPFNESAAAVGQTLGDDRHATELEQRPGFAFAVIGLDEHQSLVCQRVVKHAGQFIVGFELEEVGNQDAVGVRTIGQRSIGPEGQFEPPRESRRPVGLSQAATSVA